MTLRITILFAYLISLLPFGNVGNMVLCLAPESRDIHLEIQHHACAQTGSEDEHPSYAPSDDVQTGAKRSTCIDISLERYALTRPDERSAIKSASHDSVSLWKPRVGNEARPSFGFMFARVSGKRSFPLLPIHTTILII